jgi:hypothetical protein
VFCGSDKNATESADTVSITVPCDAADNAQQQWLSWLSWFSAVSQACVRSLGAPGFCLRARALALALAARRTSTKH